MLLFKLPIMLVNFILALLEAFTSAFAEERRLSRGYELREDLYSQDRRLIEYERLAEKINNK